MKKSAFALALTLVIVFSAFAAIHFIRLGKANPWFEARWTDPPVIFMHSPTNGTFRDAVLLNFTVTKPEKWKDTPTVYLSTPTRYGEIQQFNYAKIEVDGELYRQIEVHSNLSSPFRHTEDLTNLTEGTHTLQVFAFGTGVVEGCEWKPNTSIEINSTSELVHFTLIRDSLSPTPTMPNMGPTSPPFYPDTYQDVVYWAIFLLVAITVGIVSWLYFKKHQKDKSP